MRQSITSRCRWDAGSSPPSDCRRPSAANADDRVGPGHGGSGPAESPKAGLLARTRVLSSLSGELQSGRAES